MGSSYDERGLKIKELCFKISEYKSSIAQLQNELKSEENVTLYWQGYSQSYKKNSEYWEGRCEMYKKEIEVLKKDCGIHETNNEKDKASGDQYEKLYEEQIKVTGGLKLEITALGSAIKELQSKKTALESQIEALELHKTVVNNEVSALKDVNNALKDANAAQKNTIAAMTDNINDMKLTKTSLEIRLQARGYDMAGMKPFTKERETMLKEVTAKNGIQTMSVNELMVERAALKDALKARDTIQQTPVKTKDAEVVKEVASPMTGSDTDTLCEQEEAGDEKENITDEETSMTSVSTTASSDVDQTDVTFSSVMGLPLVMTPILLSPTTLMDLQSLM